MFDLGKRIGNEMSDDDLRSSFIFNYHLSSLDDILRKGLVEFSAGGLRLSSVGKTLNGITFAISESFSMLDYSGRQFFDEYVRFSFNVHTLVFTFSYYPTAKAGYR